MSHPREHESTLEACLASDDPLRALAESPAAACAQCKERVDELMGVNETLGELGRDVRSAAATRGAVAGEHLVGAHLVGAHLVEGVLGARLAERRRARRFRLAAVIAAAAAAFLVALYLGGRPRTPAIDRTPLGPRHLELFEPRAAGAALEFTWNAELPAGGRYEIRVTARDAGVQLAHATTETPRWTTTPTDWPRTIVWQVQVLDASGTLLDSRTAFYSLSR